MNRKTMKRVALMAGAFAACTGGALVVLGRAVESDPAVTISRQAAEDAVRSFVGRQDVPLRDLGTSDGALNTLWGFSAPDGSSFEVDARTGEVLMAHFPARESGPGVSLEAARTTAESFAARTYNGFGALRPVDEGRRDEHEAAPATYTFTWREQAGPAIGPSLVSVVVNAATGEVTSYRARRIPVTVRTLTPKVPQADAVATATRLAGYSPTSSSAELEVWLRPQDHTQRLVWRVRLNGLRPVRPGVPAEKLGLPGNFEVIVDAGTGEALSRASG